MPKFGAKDSAVHTEVYQYYLSNTQKEFGFPNVVTAILAGFRGYDTLGETLVVFTAAASVLLLVGDIKRSKKNNKDEKRK